MNEIIGKYTKAKLHLCKGENAIDDYAVAQIQALCDNPINENCKVVIMPDVHPGVVGTIGYTQVVGNGIMPNVVGVDIGCGMTLAKIKGRVNEFQKLDTVIREEVPSGSDIHKEPHRYADEIDLSRLHCYKHIQENKALRSIGSLGGGNHFIELDKDEEGNTYLIIHSGSRHLGKEATEYYLKAGQDALEAAVPYEVTYLTGDLMKQYLQDMQIIQQFADLNRRAIIDEITKAMKWKVIESYSCIHNYVQAAEDSYCGKPVIRKGAISAAKGESVIIPINMRDGVILGTGLGNDDWNQSAPHGAGRIMKRGDAKNNFTVSEFKKTMKGIYSSCIGEGTLDEAPFMYRGIEDIKDVLSETVEIKNVLHPIYNFKAGR